VKKARDATHSISRNKGGERETRAVHQVLGSWGELGIEPYVERGKERQRTELLETSKGVGSGKEQKKTEKKEKNIG